MHRAKAEAGVWAANLLQAVSPVGELGTQPSGHPGLQSWTGRAAQAQALEVGLAGTLPSHRWARSTAHSTAYSTSESGPRQQPP